MSRRDWSRRRFLRGIGGAALGLPFLESLIALHTEPFLFFWQPGNGIRMSREGDAPTGCTDQEVLAAAGV